MPQTKERLAVLGRIGWLSATPPAFRDAVLAACELRQFTAGAVIYSIGDPPGGMWGVVAGEVSLYFGTPDVSPSFSLVGLPGWWVGEASVVTRCNRKVGLTATGDATLAYLPLPAFDAIAARDPEAWRWMALHILQNELLAVEVIDDLMIRDSAARVSAVLLRIAGVRHGDGEGGPRDVQVSQERLAALANLSREQFGSVLRKLEAAGLVEIGYRNIRVRDADAMRTRVRRARVVKL